MKNEWFYSDFCCLPLSTRCHLYDPRHSITFVIDYVMQSVCRLFYASEKKLRFLYWLPVPILLQLLLRLSLRLSCCCCWLMWCVLHISFHLIWFKWWKSPIINEACWIRSTFSGLIPAKAVIKHYADENSLFSTIYLSTANTSIHSVGNYTYRMSYALKSYTNGWFRVIKQMTTHKTSTYFNSCVVYVVLRNTDSLVPFTKWTIEILCTVLNAHVFCISIRILSIVTFGVQMTSDQIEPKTCNKK